MLDRISPPSGPSLVSGLGAIDGFRHNDLATVPSTMFTSPVFTSTTSLDYAELSPNVLVRPGATRESGFHDPRVQLPRHASPAFATRESSFRDPRVPLGVAYVRSPWYARRPGHQPDRVVPRRRRPGGVTRCPWMRPSWPQCRNSSSHGRSSSSRRSVSSACWARKSRSSASNLFSPDWTFDVLIPSCCARRAATKSGSSARCRQYPATIRTRGRRARERRDHDWR